jgi:hypothetical protein
LTARVLTVTAAATLAIAGTAMAGTIKFGSDLKSPANVTETHPVDSAFWAKAFPDKRRVSAPAKGKVATVKLKGTAINLCVKKGDFVAFSDVGGYKRGSYPNGTPFRVFSSVVGSSTNYHIQSGGINNGDSFKAKTKQGEELLMRMILVTGKDAGICNR